MKKKILFITSLFPSKSEQSNGSFVFEQVKLIGTKYDVRIIVENKLEINKKKFFKILFTYPSLLFIQRVDKDYSNKSLETVALQYPFFTFYIPDILQFYLIKNSFIRLARDLFINQGWVPEIIHAHYLLNSGIFAHQISKKFKVPFIVTEHNPIYFSTGFWSGLAKSAYLNSSILFVVSHHEYRRFLTYSSEKKPCILNNYVDQEKFIIKSTNPDVFTVLYVGYPHPLKGMGLLFKVISVMKSKNVKNITFKIVSPDTKTDDFPTGISNFIYENDLTKYCELVERRTNEEMPELYQNSNTLLSTSINETFGLSILEALMCGIPVISTKSGGPEDFLNERNSLSFQIADISGIAEAILNIKNKIVKFNSEEIRSSVIQKFSKNYFLNRISTYYEEISKNL